MKNKLFICEHQFVVSDKNICEKCFIKELKKTLENSVITTFDDTPIFSQQLLNQHSKTIDSLQKINFTLNKDNSSLKSQLENQTEDFLSLEKSLKSKITELECVISNGKPLERDYKDLEDKYNKLFQLGLTNTCEFATLNTEHEIMKRDYTKLLHNTTTDVNKFNKLESEYKSLIGKYKKMKKHYIELISDYQNVKNHYTELETEHEVFKEKHKDLARYVFDTNTQLKKLKRDHKELSNELEQFKKYSKTKLIIGLGVITLVIYNITLYLT